jgi:hypothetical protein
LFLIARAEGAAGPADKNFQLKASLTYLEKIPREYAQDAPRRAANNRER